MFLYLPPPCAGILRYDFARQPPLSLRLGAHEEVGAVRSQFFRITEVQRTSVCPALLAGAEKSAAVIPQAEIGLVFITVPTTFSEDIAFGFRWRLFYFIFYVVFNHGHEGGVFEKNS